VCKLKVFPCGSCILPTICFAHVLKMLDIPIPQLCCSYYPKYFRCNSPYDLTTISTQNLLHISHFFHSACTDCPVHGSLPTIHSLHKNMWKQKLGMGYCLLTMYYPKYQLSATTYSIQIKSKWYNISTKFCKKNINRVRIWIRTHRQQGDTINCTFPFQKGNKLERHTHTVEIKMKY
jgi:hypothetical protein